jgi:hypothetical protein
LCSVICRTIDFRISCVVAFWMFRNGRVAAPASLQRCDVFFPEYNHQIIIGRVGMLRENGRLMVGICLVVLEFEVNG